MSTPATAPDQPYADTTAYGNRPDGSITDTTENAAITHHTAVLGGQKIYIAGGLAALPDSALSDRPAVRRIRTLQLENLGVK